MHYDLSKYRRRLAERADLSSQLTHVTRENESQSVTEVLLSILRDRLIRGSDPAKSFMHGERRAVCLQDVPLSGICQNVYFEDKHREELRSLREVD